MFSQLPHLLGSVNKITLAERMGVSIATLCKQALLGSFPQMPHRPKYLCEHVGDLRSFQGGTKQRALMKGESHCCYCYCWLHRSLQTFSQLSRLLRLHKFSTQCCMERLPSLQHSPVSTYSSGDGLNTERHDKGGADAPPLLLLLLLLDPAKRELAVRTCCVPDDFKNCLLCMHSYKA